MSVAVESLSVAAECSPDAPPAAWGGSPRQSPRELLAQTPPSDRDFEVYSHLMAGGGSTRSAAYEFRISQTRVMQVKKRVKAWLRALDLDGEGAEPTPADLHVARGIAGDRLNHLYGQAMLGWNSSIGDIERTRTTRRDEVQIVTNSFGDYRYLLAAAKLAMLHAKLPTQGIICEGWAQAADVLEAAGVNIDELDPPPRQVAAEEAGSEERTPGEPRADDFPSEEDCSAPGAETPDWLPAALTLPELKSRLSRSSAGRQRGRDAARSEFFAPVHQPPLGELAQSVLGGAATGSLRVGNRREARG